MNEQDHLEKPMLVEKDRLVANKKHVVKPWSRFWARYIDVFVFGSITGLLWGFIHYESLDQINELLLGVIILIVWVFVELVNLAVQENLQGQGIGKKLVLHAIEQAKSLGYRTIEVGTGSTGVGQLALYQKCGFRMVGIDRDFFIRHYAEEIYENGMQLRDMVRLSQDL